MSEEESFERSGRTHIAENRNPELSPVTESTTYICGHRKLCSQTNGGTAHNAQLLLPMQHTSIVHNYIHKYMQHSLRSEKGGGKQPTCITENRSCKFSTANVQTQ